MDLLQKGELAARSGRKWINTKAAVLRWIENTSTDDTLARAIEGGDRDALSDQQGQVRVKLKGRG
jgi:hypothetical protein